MLQWSLNQAVISDQSSILFTTGTTSGTAVMPEPATAALGLLALAAVGLTGLRRRSHGARR